MKKKKVSIYDSQIILKTIIPDKQPNLQEWLKEFNVSCRYTRFENSKDISSLKTN